MSGGAAHAVREVLCYGGPADGQVALFVVRPAVLFLMRGAVYELVGSDVAVYTGRLDPTTTHYAEKRRT